MLPVGTPLACHQLTSVPEMRYKMKKISEKEEGGRGEMEVVRRVREKREGEDRGRMRENGEKEMKN